MVTISIITTIFNSQKYILECINSIKDQSYKNYEHIIIDDGSTDSSLAIIQSNSDSKIKVISPGKIGRAKALNLGLEKSLGKYVVILDADDVALPERLAIQLATMEADSEIDLLCGNVLIINEDSQLTGESNISLEHAEIKQKLFELNPFAHSSVMYKRDFAIKAGGYNERCLKSIDFNLYLELISCGGKFKGLKKPLTKLRSYSSSWGKSDNQALQLKFAIFGLIRFYIAENKLPKQNWEKMYEYYSKWFADQKLAEKWEAKKLFKLFLGQLKALHIRKSVEYLYDALKMDPRLLLYRGSGFRYDEDVKLFLSCYNEHDIK